MMKFLENINQDDKKLINNLARLKMQEKLLKDIKFDCMVCKVEGWCPKQYINELKNLLNTLNV